jgi:DNA repair protein RecO
MSHQIFHTTAFVLGSRPSGEANKRMTLLTRELGLVHAMVQGIRHGKSKLRFALQDFSLASVDLVRGREVWRVTSGQPQESFSQLLLQKNIKPLFEKVIRLLGRLYQGEISNELLFDELVGFLRFVKDTPPLGGELPLLEVIIVTRILHHLGYSAPRENDYILLKGPFTPELFSHVRPIRARLVQEINQALQETQL